MNGKLRTGWVKEIIGRMALVFTGLVCFVKALAAMASMIRFPCEE